MSIACVFSVCACVLGSTYGMCVVCVCACVCVLSAPSCFFLYDGLQVTCACIVCRPVCLFLRCTYGMGAGRMCCLCRVLLQYICYTRHSRV